MIPPPLDCSRLRGAGRRRALLDHAAACDLAGMPKAAAHAVRLAGGLGTAPYGLVREISEVRPMAAGDCTSAAI